MEVFFLEETNYKEEKCLMLIYKDNEMFHVTNP